MAMDSDSSGIRDHFYNQLLSHFVDSLMKPGNLVRITRNAIGIPAGTVGLCLQRHQCDGFGGNDAGLEIWSVQLMNGQCRGGARRYLNIDLVEV